MANIKINIQRNIVKRIICIIVAFIIFSLNTPVAYARSIEGIKSNKEDDEFEIIEEYTIPEYSGKKTWMPYDIFGSSSNQYKLQQECTTDEEGRRLYKDRYCVAIGSHFNTSIGQYFDLELENGEIIKCVMADQKADCHTDASNIFTYNGCMSEFIVDTDTLNQDAKYSGSMSSIKDWDSPVVKLTVYKEYAEY